MIASAQVIQNVGKTARKARRPTHRHYVEYRPYQLQPILIAPVLPGETLKSLNLQARIISDPLAVGAGNIMPWWSEQWFFYVKLRDLDIRDQVENMMLKGVAPTPSVAGASAAGTQFVTGINWVELALKRIHEEFFLNEGEVASATNHLDGLPLQAAVKHGDNWADSLQVDGAIPASNDWQNPHDPLADPDNAAMYEQYQRMRAMRLIDMDFEDWLGTFGVRLPGQTERNRPELLRGLSEWSYPANTVDPTTGNATGVASFSVQETASKDRFFNEPGFVIGITSIRPKIYMGNQRQPVAYAMDNPLAWMSALMREEPHTSLREFTTTNGPLKNQTAGYWVDLRDLFLYGDQFVTGAAPGPYAPALPTAAGEKRWATSAMIDAFFAAPAKNKVRQDGVVSLNILGHPTTSTDHT